MTNKIRALVALSAAVVAGALPMGSVAGPSQRHVSIETNAQYHANGMSIDVQLHVSCDGGFGGGVQVQVSQAPPESQVPTHGNGGTNVLCDGQQHQVAVTVFAQGGPFDVGKAFRFCSAVHAGCPIPGD